jgi:hypothetical protein
LSGIPNPLDFVLFKRKKTVKKKTKKKKPKKNNKTAKHFSLQIVFEYNILDSSARFRQ